MASSSVMTLEQQHDIYFKKLENPDLTFLSTMAKKQRCVLKGQPNGLSRDYEISIDSAGNVKAKHLGFFRYSVIPAEARQADEKIIKRIEKLLLETKFQNAVATIKANAVAAITVKGIRNEQDLVSALQLTRVEQACEILHQYRLRTAPPMSQSTKKISELTFQNPVFCLENLDKKQMIRLARLRPDVVHVLCSNPLFDQSNFDVNSILLDVIQTKLSTFYYCQRFARCLPDQCLMNLMKILSHREIIFSLLEQPNLKHMALILISRVHKIQLEDSFSTTKIVLPVVHLSCLTDTDAEKFKALLELKTNVWEFLSCSTSFGEDLNLLLSNKAPFENQYSFQYSFQGKTMTSCSPVLIRTCIMSQVLNYNPDTIISQLKDVNKQYLEYDIMTIILDSLLLRHEKNEPYTKLLTSYSSWMKKLQLPTLSKTNQKLYIETIEKLHSKDLVLAIKFYLQAADYILEESKNKFLSDLIAGAWTSDDISEQDFLSLLTSMLHHDVNDLSKKLGLLPKSLNHPVHLGKLCLFIHWINEKQSKCDSKGILMSMVKQIKTLKTQSITQNYPTDHLACLLVAFSTITHNFYKVNIKSLLQALSISEVTALLRSSIFQQPIPIEAIQSLYQEPLTINPHMKAVLFNALSVEQQVQVIRELIAVKGNINDTELAKELFHSMPSEAQHISFKTHEFSILASTA